MNPTPTMGYISRDIYTWGLKTTIILQLYLRCDDTCSQPHEVTKFDKPNYMKSNFMNAWLRNFTQMLRPAVHLRYVLYSWYKCRPCVEVCLCKNTVQYSESIWSIDTCSLVCQACAPFEAQRLILRVFRRGSRELYGGLRRSESASCCVREMSSVALLCVAWDVCT